MLLLLWILNNNDNDNNNICSERGRRNSLLVNGSCIVLPHLLFLSQALITLKKMNIMNMKIQRRCLYSLYQKPKPEQSLI